MKKQATLKETKDLPQMSQEDFLEKFYDGKINYKLPSKYPENFALCKTYNDGKKEIPLTHRDKVGAILKDAYNAVKPLVKKFKLSLALLVESNVTYKGVAWTKRIRIDFSAPGATGKREELIAYTSMIQIKIRNKEFPQNPKKFLNRTTILAILLHELAHTRHMHHGIEFALFLKEMFEYAMTLGIFPENEEHMIPSSRAWERRMFETKGSMTREELDTFFEGEAGNAENMDDEHGHEWEEQEENKVEESKMTEEKGDKVSKVSQVSKVVSVKGVGGKTGVGSQQNKSEIGTVKKNVGGKALGGMKDGKMEVEKKGKVGGKEVIGSKKAVTKDVKEVKEVQEVEKNEMKVENEGEVRGDVIKMEVENVEVQVA